MQTSTNYMKRSVDIDNRSNIDIDNTTDNNENNTNSGNNKTRINDKTVAKKRRKLVKSCLFCRKRKLKCNQLKPMCQQCLDRKLPNCVYMDGFNYDIKSDELFESSPNINLLNKIKSLESQIIQLEKINERRIKNEENYKNTTDKNNNVQNKYIYDNIQSDYQNYNNILRLNQNEIINSRERNPIWNFRTSQWKLERQFIFGPSSWKTLLAAEGEKFQLEFINLWEKLKPRMENYYSMLPLNTSIKLDLNSVLISSVCKDLPKYNEIKKFLLHYFTTPLHNILSCLDQNKILKDLDNCFIRINESTNNNGDEIIIDLSPKDGQNYYKIGIILLLLSIGYYTDEVPVSIRNLLIVLNGLSCSSLNFVEKTQFLLLSCFFKIFDGRYSRWDGTDNYTVVTTLCQTALSMGLDDVNRWYRNKEDLVGNLQTLKNTFFWTLYCDVVNSFEMGRSLYISDDMFDVESLLHEKVNNDFIHNDKNYSGFLNAEKIQLLKQFIVTSRKSIQRVNSVFKYKGEDIDTSISDLQNFLELHFKDIGRYTSFGKIFTVNPFDIAILAPVLGMLFNFHNIKRSFFKDISMGTKNSLCKYGLLSLSLCVNTVLSMFETDKMLYPICVKASKKLTPFLNLSLPLTISLSVRLLSELYGTFFARLTSRQRGYLLMAHHDSSKIELDTLDIPIENYYSFTEFIEYFHKILDQFADEKYSDLHKLIKTSYPLVSLLALDNVGRMLFSKAVSSRGYVEKRWKKKGFNLDDLSDDLLKVFVNDVWENYASRTSEIWSTDPDSLIEKVTKYDVNELRIATNNYENNY